MQARLLFDTAAPCRTLPCSSPVLHSVSGLGDASLFLLYCVRGPGSTVTAFGCHGGCFFPCFFSFLYHSALYLQIFNYHPFIAEHLETFSLKYTLVLSLELEQTFPICIPVFLMCFSHLHCFPVCLCLMS